MKINSWLILLSFLLVMISCNRDIKPTIYFSSDVDSLRFKLDTCLANFSERRPNWENEIHEFAIQKTDTAWEFNIQLKDSQFWDEKVKDYEILNSNLANHVLDSQIVMLHLIDNGKTLYTSSSKERLQIQVVLGMTVPKHLGPEEDTFATEESPKSRIAFQFDHPIDMEQGGKIYTIFEPILFDMASQNDGLLVKSYKQKDTIFADFPYVGISIIDGNDSAFFYSWANEIRDSVFPEFPVLIRLLDSNKNATKYFISNNIQYNFK